MGFGEPGIGHHPLRLEPQDVAQAVLVGRVADRFQPAWKTLRIGYPCTGDRPAIFEPARIHLPVVDRQVVLDNRLDAAPRLLLARVVEAYVAGRARPDRPDDRLTATARGVLLEQQATEHGLAVYSVP